MKNSECVISIETEHSSRTILKEGDHWVMTVASNTKAYKMTPEQLLSHLLPALLDQRVSVRVIRRA